MTEEKKELNFRDMTAKESFSTTEYNIEEGTDGKAWAVAISPKGNKAQRLVKDESREKNKTTIRKLNWIGYLLPAIAGIGVIITDNLLWLWISILATFIASELLYRASILKIKFTKDIFYWKKEKFIAFCIGIGAVFGYLLSGYIIKQIIRNFGMEVIMGWFAIYGLGIAIAIICIMAIIGLLVMNKNQPIELLGKERVR
jgi:hypothetical protein